MLAHAHSASAYFWHKIIYITQQWYVRIELFLIKYKQNSFFWQRVPLLRMSHNALHLICIIGKLKNIILSTCGLQPNIYTSISDALISITGRLKFIPRWTPLALSPRKGTENTNDVRNPPLFLVSCYFKIAST